MAAPDFYNDTFRALTADLEPASLMECARDGTLVIADAEAGAALREDLLAAYAHMLCDFGGSGNELRIAQALHAQLGKCVCASFGDLLVVGGTGLVGVDDEEGEIAAAIVAEGNTRLYGALCGIAYGVYPMASQAAIRAHEAGESEELDMRDVQGPLVVLEEAQICRIESYGPEHLASERAYVPLGDRNLALYRGWAA